MAHTLVSRNDIATGRLAHQSTRTIPRVGSVGQLCEVKGIIRYCFYAFVFSLPFEQAYIAGGATLPKLFGLALAGFALLQPGLCYKRPPSAFWWFVLYLFVFTLWSAYLFLDPPNVPDFAGLVLTQFITVAQLLVLFWISYNLLKQEQVVNGTLWAYTAASILLAVLQLGGVTSNMSAQGRVAAFEGNPNALATVLSLGLLALVGLGYGREKQDWKARIVFWMGCGILAVAMVQTGSRGTLLALVGALSLFFLKGKRFATKVKFGTVGVMGIVLLVAASYRIDAVRIRWENTFYDEDVAGRQKIYPAALAMVLERPLTGWGPVNHLWELGPRVGRPYRDEHNVYLWILAEAGFVGAVPFFTGLWLCWRSAWRARNGSQGILPLVMLLFLLGVSMKSTIYKDKYFWLVLSLALASSSYGAGLQKSRPVTLVRRPKGNANHRRPVFS